MGSLALINARIKAIEPLVELVRGEGYLYYVFDNSIGDKMTPDGFHVGDHMVFDTESVSVPYIKHRTDAQWIEDGIDYGRRIREQHELPAAENA